MTERNSGEIVVIKYLLKYLIKSQREVSFGCTTKAFLMFLSVAAAVTGASAAAHRDTLLPKSLADCLKHSLPSARLFLLSRWAFMTGELLPISL